MKTTIEIPDPLFRKAKATAASLGRTLKDLVTEALRISRSAQMNHFMNVAPDKRLAFAKLPVLGRDADWHAVFHGKRNNSFQ